MKRVTQLSVMTRSYTEDPDGEYLLVREDLSDLDLEAAAEASDWTLSEAMLRAAVCAALGVKEETP